MNSFSMAGFAGLFGACAVSSLAGLVLFLAGALFGLEWPQQVGGWLTVPLTAFWIVMLAAVAGGFLLALLSWMWQAPGLFLSWLAAGRLRRKLD